jgi:hypothetical protein
MSADVERRLRSAFERLPRPTRDATARARTSALATLPPQPPRSAGWLVLVVAAIAAAVVGAAALAATGKLHVVIGARSGGVANARSQFALPPRSDGIAVVAGGRLWLRTRAGLGIEGMPVSAAELSPRALYAVVGLGSSLVALAPGQRRAWVRRTGGRVVAAAWSPDGLKIAYVVARAGRHELRLIEGDGSPDRVLARRVAPVKPSWRADSLAVAHVDAKGRAVVDYLDAGARRTFDERRCGGRATGVAYAPRAPALAVVAPRGIAVVRLWKQRPRCARFDRSASPTAVGWSGQQVVAGLTRMHGGSVARLRQNLNEIAAALTGRSVTAIAVAPVGSQIAVAVRAGRQLEVGIAPAPALGTKLRLTRSLLRLKTDVRAVSISWR